MFLVLILEAARVLTGIPRPALLRFYLSGSRVREVLRCFDHGGSR
jgi:hypothetical protein